MYLNVHKRTGISTYTDRQRQSGDDYGQLTGLLVLNNSAFPWIKKRLAGEQAEREGNRGITEYDDTLIFLLVK